jgi:8-oxo-dGTP pyrophosphatase MutT (NUDIX family)
MNKVTEFVGVILIDNQGRIALQLREHNRELNPDHWSVFGGHIENGEEPEQAAIREIEEELSVILSPKKMEPLGRFVRENHAYSIFIYPVSHELDKAELKEGCSWRWCDPKEIQEGVVEGKRIVDYHARFLLQFLDSRNLEKLD